MYSSDTTDPMETPKMAPAEAAGLPRPMFMITEARIRPEITLNSTSSTSSTVVGSILPLPWQ